MTLEGRQEEGRERDIPSQSVPGKELVKCLVCSGNSKQNSVPGKYEEDGEVWDWRSYLEALLSCKWL